MSFFVPVSNVLPVVCSASAKSVAYHLSFHQLSPLQTPHEKTDMLKENPVSIDPTRRQHKPRLPGKLAIAAGAVLCFLWFSLCHDSRKGQASYARSAQDPLQRHTRNVTIQDFYAGSHVQPSALPSSLPDEDLYFHHRIKLRPLSPTTVSRDQFDIWLKQQTRVCFEKLLANIGDSNLNDLPTAERVSEGVVLASPSKKNPDYFYHWVRDGSITMNTVVKSLVPAQDPSSLNLTLAGTVLKFLNTSFVLQRTDNPSGTCKRDLKGLGEPKWLVNNTPFTGNWGRPQSDGPALRLITVFNFLATLRALELPLETVIADFQKTYNQDLQLPFHNERDLFETVVKLDLQYVVNNWHADTFDLWEEVNAQHFFTTLCQLKAVQLGWHYLTEIQPDFDDPETQVAASSLKQEFDKILKFLMVDGGFLNANKNYIIETPAILGKRSGLDIAVLLAAVITHDPGLDGTVDFNIPFDVDDTGVLNTLHGLVAEMQILYPVNHQRANLNLGVALGRYPEDVYDGTGISEGNPWFLATTTAAELLYKVISHFYTAETDLVIPLDGWTTQFWSLIFENIDFSQKTGDSWQLVIPFDSPAYTQTMISLLRFGDSFLDKVREHVSDDGSMSEQFNKYSGFLQGATDLTWSYGSFWSSSHWRSQVMSKMACAQK
ncbi:LAMI_0E04148g1_1 [Lachancea mirantina]|uniref:glucan 1,4-alpha-glucosidase n=1 Tax=Lachancea mirantina TaxID=1230905 RepID=A0A1G4JKU9_9SACH|nr:LAMI_0E04148g1_1 [Lachancea mirantina]